MPDRFYIGYTDSNASLETDLRPYALPENAFTKLNNAYVFRGRVRKRFGSYYVNEIGNQLNSRLRFNIGNNTNAAMNLPANTSAHTPQLAIGQIFSLDGDIFTVYQLGAGVATYTTNPAVTAQIDSVAAPNTITFTGGAVGAGHPVYWYPALPVMGLLTFDNNVLDNEPTIVFDTEFAYAYNTTTGGFERLSGGGAASIWTGTDTNFFWSTSWTGASPSTQLFFVTNNNPLEPNFMRYYDGTNWNNFRPKIDATPTYLFASLILVVFKNRMLAINTWEGTAQTPGNYFNFPARIRWSSLGDVTDVANQWLQDVPGRGNYLDIPTTEAVITAEFVKDRLILYLERSTWEVVNLGNQAYPFAVQQINTELGAESTNSVVPFDKIALGIGNVGIHACNGANVERIDNKIPDQVFDIHNNSSDTGVQRVYGVRDYLTEMVYWSFPDTSTSTTFPYPNKVIVYNYRTGAWAFNDDSITAFGYFISPLAGSTESSASWDSAIVSWDSTESWGAENLQIGFRQVIAGNQEGYVFIIDPNEPTNASVLQITDIAIGAGNVITIKVINHNLRPNDYILISGVVGTGTMTSLNNKVFAVTIDFTAPNTFTIVPDFVLTGTYRGGGTISRVSVIDIWTKQFNFYAKEDKNANFTKVDFLVDATTNGQMQVNYYISTSQSQLVPNGLANGVILGNGTLITSPFTTFYPYEATATRFWRPYYMFAEGSYIQLQITMNPTQLKTIITNADGSITGPALQDFQMGAMIITAERTSDRLQ